MGEQCRRRPATTYDVCVLFPFPLLAAVLLQSSALPGGMPAAERVTPHAWRFNWARDGAVTAVGGMLWIGSETLFKSRLAPADCRWCDRGPEGSNTLNALDTWGRGLAGTLEQQKRAD